MKSLTEIRQLAKKNHLDYDRELKNINTNQLKEVYTEFIQKLGDALIEVMQSGIEGIDYDRTYFQVKVSDILQKIGTTFSNENNVSYTFADLWFGLADNITGKRSKEFHKCAGLYFDKQKYIKDYLVDKRFISDTNYISICLSHNKLNQGPIEDYYFEIFIRDNDEKTSPIFTKKHLFY
jgi:hypothetical protein